MNLLTATEADVIFPLQVFAFIEALSSDLISVNDAVLPSIVAPPMLQVEEASSWGVKNNHRITRRTEHGLRNFIAAFLPEKCTNELIRL